MSLLYLVSCFLVIPGLVLFFVWTICNISAQSDPIKRAEACLLGNQLPRAHTPEKVLRK